MNRRDFIASATAVAATAACPVPAQAPEQVHGFSTSMLRDVDYVETTPIAEYHNAPASAYEAFQDMKFGIRIHWGIYSIWHRGAESWPFLPMSFEDRQTYNRLYKTWNPAGFDADAWMDDFRESGLKMFAFTSKHHEGFSMFDTRTRVKSRANWTAPGGPRIEACDLAYSIMETPFRRDIIKELSDAAHKRDIKIDLYFSHPDWYDADFRPYVAHPLQIPSSAQWMSRIDFEFTQRRLGGHAVVVPDPTDAEVKRMMERHRAQLLELLTNYGKIDMIGLDMWLGPRVWPELRKTLLMMRELQPDVMLRNRGIGNAEYPLVRKRDDPDYATQSHCDQMKALSGATKRVVAESGLDGEQIDSLAVDTTGSSVIVVDAELQPLDDYYLWCDHRAKDKAREITDLAHQEGLEAIEWCGGAYSHEWGFSKFLHWLRHNPEKRDRFATALENCDMVTATLCGITNPLELKRSICAMGHKWMWNSKWGGLPPQQFLSKVDPLFDGVREKIAGEYLTSDHLAGGLTPVWATRLNLRPGIPIPVGAFDAHWDAIGAGCKEGDVVNVVGTSTCIMAIQRNPRLVPGVCGVVPGSVHPGYTGVEAGLSATGDIFEAIARRAGTTVAELAHGLETFRAGQTGLLRLSWDNGDRTVLVNPELGGVTLGWNLIHTAQDELYAAIEGTAFHTRIILERMEQYGVPVNRVINAGGIPQNNPILNQTYADVLGKPVLVPDGIPTSLGSSIFAFLAAGAFRSVEEAQEQVCLPFKSYSPQSEAHRVYNRLYELYQRFYFSLGQRGSDPVALGDLLPELRKIAGYSVSRQGGL